MKTSHGLKKFTPPLIGVSALIPYSLEARLHRACAVMRHDVGFEYGETFAEILELGITALANKKAAAYAVGSSALSKAAQ
jgi:hypothetical protein